MRGYRAAGPQNNRSGASPNAVCLFLYLEHPPNAVNIISYHIISPLLVSAAMKRPAKSGSSGSRAPGAASSFQTLKGRLEEEERQRKKEERKRKELEKALDRAKEEKEEEKKKRVELEGALRAEREQRQSLVNAAVRASWCGI